MASDQETKSTEKEKAEAVHDALREEAKNLATARRREMEGGLEREAEKSVVNYVLKLDGRRRLLGIEGRDKDGNLVSYQDNRKSFDRTRGLGLLLHESLEKRMLEGGVMDDAETKQRGDTATDFQNVGTAEQQPDRTARPAGQSAKRLQRPAEGTKQKGMSFPKSVAAEFERRAAAQGVSFNRYVYDTFIAPHTGDIPPESSESDLDRS